MEGEEGEAGEEGRGGVCYMNDINHRYYDGILFFIGCERWREIVGKTVRWRMIMTEVRERVGIGCTFSFLMKRWRTGIFKMRNLLF